MTGEQVRAARKLLGLSLPQMALLAGIPESALQHFERRDVMSVAASPGRPDRLERLRHALESAGIEFDGGEAAGVKLRRGDDDSI